MRNKFQIWLRIISTLYLREQGSKDPWLIVESKRNPQIKNFGKQLLRQ
jgi:hypothetical protein